MDLKRPIFSKLSGFGHFGRNDPDFVWESILDLSRIGALTEKELANSETDFS